LNDVITFAKAMTSAKVGTTSPRTLLLHDEINTFFDHCSDKKVSGIESIT
jgi:hypothetical protein